jgi:hypothetical protein
VGTSHKQLPQPPSDPDALLRDAARLLRRTDWRVHLACIARDMGAIGARELTIVRAAAFVGVLDDLNSELGRAAWAALAKWLPDDGEN